MTEVNFYDSSYLPGEGLTYSVIAARHDNKWLFVRHHLRETWEIAGGHIEKGETPEEAAVRELMEETGAIEFDIRCVATYSVRKQGETGYGRLYYADVTTLGMLPADSEIADVVMLDNLPERLTHPDIQPDLFGRIVMYLNEGIQG